MGKSYVSAAPYVSSEAHFSKSECGNTDRRRGRDGSIPRFSRLFLGTSHVSHLLISRLLDSAL